MRTVGAGVNKNKSINMAEWEAEKQMLREANENARKRIYELEFLLDESREQTAKLQAELDESREQMAKLQAELDKSREQAGTEQKEKNPKEKSTAK